MSPTGDLLAGDALNEGSAEYGDPLTPQLVKSHAAAMVTKLGTPALSAVPNFQMAYAGPDLTVEQLAERLESTPAAQAMNARTSGGDLLQAGPAEIEELGRTLAHEVGAALSELLPRRWKVNFTKAGKMMTKRFFNKSDANAFAATLSKKSAAVVSQMEKGDSGYGWYDRKVRAAMKIMRKVHPSFKDHPLNEFWFKVGLAITSQGMDVVSNFEHGHAVYEYFINPTNARRMPGTVQFGGKAQESIIKNLWKVNDIIELLGEQKAMEFLTHEFTVGDLTRVGFKVSGEWAAFAVRGLMLLGPKIGSFAGNLMGRFDTTTMDMWWTRSIRRYLGNMFKFNSDRFLGKGVHPVVARARLEEVVSMMANMEGKLGKNEELIVEQAKLALAQQHGVNAAWLRENAPDFWAWAGKQSKTVTGAAEDEDPDSLAQATHEWVDPIASEGQLPRLRRLMLADPAAGGAQREAVLADIERVMVQGRANGSVTREWVRANASTLWNWSKSVERAITDRQGKNKLDWEQAAQYWLTEATKTDDAPKSPAERMAMRRVVAHAKELMAQAGIPIEYADLQAILWFYEKDLYDIHGAVTERGEKEDYEGAARKLAHKLENGQAITSIVGRGTQQGNLPAGSAGSVRAYEREAAGRALGLPEGSARSEPGGVAQSLAGGSEGHAGGVAPVKAAKAPQGTIAAIKKVAGAFWKPTRAARMALMSDVVGRTQAVGTGMIELDNSPAAAALFHKMIWESKAADPRFGSSVFAYSAADYTKMRTFLLPDGSGGFAIKPDGDMVSVFVKPGQAGAASPLGQMMLLAVQAGARKADCFDTVLPFLYGHYGFRPVARVEWDPSQAPRQHAVMKGNKVTEYATHAEAVAAAAKGGQNARLVSQEWNPQHYAKFNGGQPDVMMLVYDGGNPETLHQRVGNFKDITTPAAPVSYDEALRKQKAAARIVAKRLGDTKTNVSAVTVPVETALKEEEAVYGGRSTPQRVYASTSVAALRSDPRFNPAKVHGDARSAMGLVAKFLKPETLQQLESFRGMNPVIVPVLGREGKSMNAIPLALARKIAQHLGGTVWTRLVKTSAQHNTDAAANDRSRNEHRWSGAMPPRSRPIIVVDDTFTTGQTISSLISRLGGASAAVTLSSGRYGRALQADQEIIDKAAAKANIPADVISSRYPHLTGAQLQQYLLNGAAGERGFVDRFAAGRGSEAAAGNAGSGLGRVGADDLETFLREGDPGYGSVPSTPEFDTRRFGLRAQSDDRLRV